MDRPPTPAWNSAARSVRLRRLVLPWALAVLVVLWLHALTLQGLAQMLPGLASETPAAPATRAFITRTVRIDNAAPKAAPAAPREAAPKPRPSKAPSNKQSTTATQSALAPAGTPLAQTDAQDPEPPQVPTLATGAPKTEVPREAARAEPGAAADGQALAVDGLSASGSVQTSSTAQALASADPTPAPVYDYLVPGSTRLKYDVSGVVKGFKYYVSGELLWLQDGKTYDARLEISHFLLGSRVQTSKGALTALGLEPLRFGDKVRSEVAAHFQRAKGLVSFSANTPDVPLLPLAQDQLSVFVQLAAMWGAKPARFDPGLQLPFQAVGPRSAENWVFVVGATERLGVDGREMEATKLLRENSADYGVRVEVWLAPALEYLPARIRLTQSNGDEVDMLWRKTEKP